MSAYVTSKSALKAAYEFIRFHFAVFMQTQCNTMFLTQCNERQRYVKKQNKTRNI